jgi:hypothetical protein
MGRAWLLLVAAVLGGSLLGACGSEEALSRAPGFRSPSPDAVPAAAGRVATRDPVTVIDAGDGPRMCLGPVAESWPPQCSGPVVRGWRWSDHRGTFERRGPVRWGQYALTGRWDGTTFTCAGAVPAALHDPAATTPRGRRSPGHRLSPAELRRVADDVAHLPGAQVVRVDRPHVLVDVTYDDGTLQDHVDQTYGRDVVLVTSLLVDEEG